MYKKKKKKKRIRPKKKRNIKEHHICGEKKGFILFFIFYEELTVCWKSYLGFTTIDKLAQSFAFRDYWYCQSNI